MCFYKIGKIWIYFIFKKKMYYYIKRKTGKSNKKLKTPSSTESWDLGHEDVVKSPGLLRPWYFWHKIPGNFDENNSSKQQKFREFLHFLHTKFREFLRKKATSRCFFSKKFREFLLRKMAKIPGILKKKQCAQKLQVFLL